LRIVNVEVTPVLYKLKEVLRWGNMTVSAKGSTLVKILTDENVIGIGEAGFSAIYEPWIHLHVEKLKPVIINQDPLMLKKFGRKCMV